MFKFIAGLMASIGGLMSRGRFGAQTAEPVRMIKAPKTKHGGGGARPAGSKLARMAAEGRIGLGGVR